MERQTNFRVVHVKDEIQVAEDEIVIALDNFSFDNDKHYITDPIAANAQFVCSGTVYSVGNTNCIPTVEDWYSQELLPKYQMLSLLMTPDDK